MINPGEVVVPTRTVKIGRPAEPFRQSQRLSSERLGLSEAALILIQPGEVIVVAGERGMVSRQLLLVGRYGLLVESARLQQAALLPIEQGKVVRGCRRLRGIVALLIRTRLRMTL